MKNCVGITFMKSKLNISTLAKVEIFFDIASESLEEKKISKNKLNFHTLNHQICF